MVDYNEGRKGKNNMSVVRCFECGEDLIIKRERVIMMTRTDCYEVRDNTTFRQCDSEAEEGTLESEEFSCEKCGSSVDETLIDKLLESLGE